MKFNHITKIVLLLISGINITSFAAESLENDSDEIIHNIINFYHTNYAADFGNIIIEHMSADKNYFMQFETEEKAKFFSDYIAILDIKGSSGNNKYVAKHYYSDYFGIILTSQNLEMLYNKVKEVKSCIK